MAQPRIGLKIKLVAYEAKYAPHLMKWYYDVHYKSFFREFDDLPLGLKEFEDFGTVMAQGLVGFYVIIEKNTQEPIGLMTHNCLKRKAGVHRFGIMLERESQNKTYAIEAIILLAFYLFQNKGCRKLVIEYLATDVQIQRISEKGGFVREARLKDECIIDGQYVDEVKYYITKEKAYELYGEYHKSLQQSEEKGPKLKVIDSQQKNMDHEL